MKFKIEQADTERFAKRMLWLAWQACGGPLGMGIMQNHPEATEDEVFSNVQRQGDYPFAVRSEKNKLDADYVFGRMMKLHVAYGDDWVEVRPQEPRPDYQAWARRFRTVDALVDLTAAELNCKAVRAV